MKPNNGSSVPHHDYTARYWGHDYTFDPKDGGMKGRMMGWGHGIEAGHFLIIQNGEAATRYRVDAIRYMGDPPDMWSADVSFAPRKQRQIAREGLT